MGVYIYIYMCVYILCLHTWRLPVIYTMDHQHAGCSTWRRLFKTVLSDHWQARPDFRSCKTAPCSREVHDIAYMPSWDYDRI